jgi:hypothetical protein
LKGAAKQDSDSNPNNNIGVNKVITSENRKTNLPSTIPTRRVSPFEVVVFSNKKDKPLGQQPYHNSSNFSGRDYYESTSSTTGSLLDWTLENFSDHFLTCGGGDVAACHRSSPTAGSASKTATTPLFDCSSSSRHDDGSSHSISFLQHYKQQEDDSDPYLTSKSLYRKTIMTAATVNNSDLSSDTNEAAAFSSANPSVDTGAATAADASAEGNSSTTGSGGTTPQEQLKKTAFQFARGFDDAGRAIGNLLPTASLQNITTRKYTLPDKTVASQVLMYRQLLHTKCRPGLKLSRPYQGTPAQKAVMHMPWWEHGIEESKKMVISYDNLITRLWLNGAIEPFQFQPQSTSTADEVDLLGIVPETSSSSTATRPPELETFITEEGLPPVPHEFWVERLGFQQPDPVTDFRSGGVLSLAMMVYMVESKPVICQRFFTGDTKVLPFGITCINVTDMIAKFLMLAKSTDRMDALLSQKPFWKMFADPNAILAVQELAMSMLCDVTIELGQEKRIPALAKQTSEHIPGDANDKVRLSRGGRPSTTQLIYASRYL